MAKKLSCIVAVENQPELLAHALQQFRRQDYLDKELVVVLSGTPWAGPERDDPAIVVVEAPLGTPLATKINLGWDQASGEILAKWDGGDFYAPTAMSRAVAEMERTNAQFVAWADNLLILTPLPLLVSVMRWGFLRLGVFTRDCARFRAQAPWNTGTMFLQDNVAIGIWPRLIQKAEMLYGYWCHSGPGLWEQTSYFADGETRFVPAATVLLGRSTLRRDLNWQSVLGESYDFYASQTAPQAVAPEGGVA
jgi:hypothetical protein